MKNIFKLSLLLSIFIFFPTESYAEELIDEDAENDEEEIQEEEIILEED